MMMWPDYVCPTKHQAKEWNGMEAMAGSPTSREARSEQKAKISKKDKLTIVDDNESIHSVPWHTLQLKADAIV
jgi:hypothetical protein